MLRRGKRRDTFANPFEDLRRRALGAVDEGLAPPGPEHPSVWGVVIDVPTTGRATAAVVALGDGTTNLHLSSGRTITASHDPASVAAGQTLLAMIEQHALDSLVPESGKKPRSDQARFHVLGPDGLRGMDVPRKMVWGEEEGGGPVVAATQDLLRCLRRLAPDPLEG